MNFYLHEFTNLIYNYIYIAFSFNKILFNVISNKNKNYNKN